MESKAYLAGLGWPESALNLAGVAERTAVAADGVSMLRATVTRDESGIKILVATVGLEGVEPLARIDAVEGASGVEVVSSSLGNPPEACDPEEALGIFAHLAKGMGPVRFKPSFSMDRSEPKSGGMNA